MKRNQDAGRIRYLTHGGMIAALYVVLTLLSSAMGLSSGVVQLRLSEALCVLPFFTPAALPGLTVGCLIANLATGCIWQDVLVGTFATFLGAWGAGLLRKKSPWLVPIPTVVANTLLIPPVLCYCYHAEQGIFMAAACIAAGEILSTGIGLAILYTVLKNHQKIFYPYDEKSKFRKK